MEIVDKVEKSTSFGNSRKNLIIMGMKHSGKSSVGEKAARALSLPFFDLDTIIEELYGKISCREIYKNEGKKYFKRLESEAAEEFVRRTERSGRAILALGGGTIENAEAMARLKPAGFFIYLQEDPDVLFKRIEAGGIPPFLSSEDPYGSFLALYEKRTMLYEQAADSIITARGREVDAITEELIKKTEE